jgi:carboxypeptidase C (cathepsin A)
LGFRTDVTFRLLEADISRRWDWGTRGGRQGYAGVLDELQQARSANSALQVMIASGYTDLVTPYLAARYLVGQLAPLRGAPPIRLEDYEGGHMMYLRADSRKALTADVAALYARALEAGARVP